MSALVALVLMAAAPSKTEIEMRRTELGRQVFFDPACSITGTVSCGTCHRPEMGWSDGRQTAEGVLRVQVVNGRRIVQPGIGTRNTPVIPFAADNDLQFWDGRTIGIREQALQPLVNPLEMANDSVDQVVRRLRRAYGRRFAEVYRDGLTEETLADAIARFERKITPTDAPFVRYEAGYRFALSPEAARGYHLFKRDCTACHAGTALTDRRFHNTGVSWSTAEQGDDALGRFAIMDPTLRERTPEQVRAFKTPTLWDVAKSGPYTHAGRIRKLETIVDRYSDGWRNGAGTLDPFRDRRAGPLHYSLQQRSDVVSFLREGTASKWASGFSR